MFFKRNIALFLRLYANDAILKNEYFFQVFTFFDKKQ